MKPDIQIRRKQAR